MRWIKLLTVISMPFLLQGQTPDDAIRLSWNTLGGTARTLGLGGAGGAMGADFGTTLINPAGTALARKSSMVFGLAFQGYGNQSEYIDESTSASSFRVNMPVAGMIIHWPSKNPDQTLKTKGVVGWSLDFGFNRVNDFNRKINFAGTNLASSVLDKWAWDAFGATPAELDAENSMSGLAWSTYLIDRVPNSNPPNYEAALFSDSKARQVQELSRRGRINDWHIGMAMNISNSFYLGGAMLIPGVRFTNNLVYREFYDQNALGVQSSLQQNSSYTTEGTGFGGRFGAIYRPSDKLRLGLSYQTRIRYGLTDIFADTLASTGFVSPGQSIRAATQTLQSEYTIITPGHLTFSGTFIFNNVFLINADVSLIDYGSTRLESRNYSFAPENNDISIFYGNATNVRIGGEYAYYDWRFRAGFALLGQPFSARTGQSTAAYHSKNITFGAGYIKKYFFIDAALITTWFKDFYTPYALDPGTNREYYSAENLFQTTRFVISTGFRWN